MLLNKVDLVDDSGLENVKSRIRKINPYAKIIKTTRCAAPLDEILGLNAFSLKRVLEVEPDFLNLIMITITMMMSLVFHLFRKHL